MPDPTANEPDVAQQRSPRYPYISLDLALERAAKLYEQVRDTPQPREVMAKAYGKPATSSATIQTFATLTQYGLLEPVLAPGGTRKIRVTQLARSITHPNAPADVVAQGRKTAALKPGIFRELWDAYGSTEGLNDGAILYYLTQDREHAHGSVFTEKAAQEVLRVYRATLAFAGLSDVDKKETEADGGEADQSEEVVVVQDDRADRADRSGDVSPRKQVRGLQLAEHERELQSGMLSKTAAYRVIVSGPIGVKEIERLIRKLEMDKEILADDDSTDDDVPT